MTSALKWKFRKYIVKPFISSPFYESLVMAVFQSIIGSVWPGALPAPCLKCCFSNVSMSIVHTRITLKYRSGVGWSEMRLAQVYLWGPQSFCHCSWTGLGCHRQVRGLLQGPRKSPMFQVFIVLSLLSPENDHGSQTFKVRKSCFLWLSLWFIYLCFPLSIVGTRCYISFRHRI